MCVDFFMSFGTVLNYLRDFCAKGGAALQQQSLDLAQSLVIFGAIKNRRIYVFHEEPLMDEDYTLLLKNLTVIVFCPLI